MKAMGIVTVIIFALLSQPGLTASPATVAVVERPVAEQRFFDGVVEAVNEATIAAQVSDRITEIYFDVNDYVPRGEVIIRFRDTQAKAALAQAEAGRREAQARLSEAEKEFERIRNIYSKKLVARAAMDKATADLNAAKARLEQAIAQVASANEQLENTIVRAPYSGIVTRRHVEVGETPRVGAPLITGLSLAQLRVSTSVPQHFVTVLRGDCCPATIVDNKGRPVQVSKLTIAPKADPLSHSFLVRLDLSPGEYGLYPGMFVKVAITVDEKPRLMIPLAALVKRSEVTGVYVANAEGKYSFRHVRSGRVHNAEVEIHAGLSVGEQVALDPVQAGILLKQDARQE
jgi:RND family efflux transporter MFP subunit